ncbi:hypothetical protein B0H13DRAFT_2484202 [Mycena leptocephala]|nr:hypothetical protein B0H13DRAFT_2484202 [Mycena leptocephala]
MHLTRSCPKPVDSARRRNTCDSLGHPQSLRCLWSQHTSGDWRLPYLEVAAVRSRRVPWRGRVPLRVRSLYTTFTALRPDALFTATSPACGAAPLRRPEYPSTRDPQAPPCSPHMQIPLLRRSVLRHRISSSLTTALRALLHLHDIDFDPVSTSHAPPLTCLTWCTSGSSACSSARCRQRSVAHRCELGLVCAYIRASR